MIYIYVLEKNNIPFYIGKTKNPKSRLNKHKKIHSCEVFIIDNITDDEWKFWEKHYISLFKSWGFILENKNNGGGGPSSIKFSKERNEKISKATKGKVTSLKTKEAVSKANKGHKYNLGRIQSDETKLKISLATKGKPKHTPESMEKRSQKMRGRKLDEKTKQKMSKSHLGKKKSPQHVLNMMMNRKNVIEGVKLSNSKPIIQKDLNGNFIKEWFSISEAKKIFGGSIGSCCNGKLKTSGGFKWEFKSKN